MKKANQEAKADLSVPPSKSGWHDISPKKAEAEIIWAARRKLVDHVPEFIDKLIEIARRPGRNSQTQLAAIKDGMNRAGLIELRTAQITSETTDGQSVTLNVNFLPPKKDDE